MDMDGAADFMAGDPSGRVDLDASAWKRARISSVQLLWSRCYRGPFLIGRGLIAVVCTVLSADGAGTLPSAASRDRFLFPRSSSTSLKPNLWGPRSSILPQTFLAASTLVPLSNYSDRKRGTRAASSGRNREQVLRCSLYRAKR